MATLYTETPANFSEIEPYVITDVRETVSQIYRKKKCFFYDTCSFRYHSGLEKDSARYLFKYVKKTDGIVIITRCILMELASLSGILNQQYIEYIKAMSQAGIKVLVIYEEDLFAVLDVCFGTNAAINGYLTWAVRMMNLSVSTIADTFFECPGLKADVIGGKNAERKDMYKRFFTAVRNHKTEGDNLGEELLAICLHILSYIPGEEDEKFCVITDDKGAAGKIDCLFKNTFSQYQGNHIVIFSTPKLVQFMYAEAVLEDIAQMKKILNAGNNGNIVVFGIRSYDLECADISISCEELAEKISIPNQIYIIF